MFSYVFKTICVIFNPIPFQFANSDILHSDWIMSQWWLHWPRKCKSQHSVVPTSTLTLHPSRQLLLNFQNDSLDEGWQLFALWCHCWGCLTITAPLSSSVDAYVCTIWTNPATMRSLDRFTLFAAAVLPRSKPLWKAEGKWGEDTISRQIQSRPLVWKIAFWPLLCMCEFNRRNERETMPIRDLLLQSMITRGCQHLCNDTTVLLCNDNTYHIKTVTGY